MMFITIVFRLLALKHAFKTTLIQNFTSKTSNVYCSQPIYRILEKENKQLW